MKLIYTEEFKGDLKKIRDKKTQTRIKKIAQKILDNPEIGKPLGYELFPLRSVRIPPFRVLKNPLERKNEFLKIKKDFYEYVISIPKDKAPKPEYETGIAYVSIEELKDRYDLETGFMPGSGGTLLF